MWLLKKVGKIVLSVKKLQANYFSKIYSVMFASHFLVIRSVIHKSKTIMAAAPDPGEILRSTSGKENFQRITRLLISGGTSLLREIFDSICPPSNLPTILSNPVTKNQLKAAKLTMPQWHCLCPSPGVYGKSADFDVTLLVRLLRTICNLTPPSTGWDALPVSADHSLTADIARIKYYRNSVYGHVSQGMAITDNEFKTLWQEISEALVRIAGQISSTTKTAWQGAIDKYLTDPLTTEDERNAEELKAWYKNDVEIKKSIDEFSERISRLEVGLKVKKKTNKAKPKHTGCFKNSFRFFIPLNFTNISNSPNPSRVYIRLCKHRKRFLLLN